MKKVTFILMSIFTAFSCETTENVILAKSIAIQAAGSRINCSKNQDIQDCCGANSFACTGTGNPITLSLDQMKGFSKAELLADGRVLVTNTFEETNWSESTFKTFISTKVAELKVEATASSALLREVYKEAKITGFPENITIKPQKVNVNIEGQGHVNNKIRFIQQYYIDKSGDTKLAHTIQVK
jgi:hypothetical protein